MALTYEYSRHFIQKAKVVRLDKSNDFLMFSIKFHCMSKEKKKQLECWESILLYYKSQWGTRICMLLSPKINLNKINTHRSRKNFTNIKLICQNEMSIPMYVCIYLQCQENKKTHKITFYGPKRIISMFPPKYSFHRPHIGFMLLKTWQQRNIFTLLVSNNYDYGIFLFWDPGRYSYRLKFCPL